MQTRRLPTTGTCLQRKTGTENLEKTGLQYRLQEALEEDGGCTQLWSARPGRQEGETSRDSG